MARTTVPGSARQERRNRQRDARRPTKLIFEACTAHSACGAIRIARELRRRGVAVGRRIVARLMRENCIAGVTWRRRRNLAEPSAGAATVPDLIRRDFTAPMPGLKLIGDISCFATREGRLYLAIAVDLCSREMVGYAITPHMRQSRSGHEETVHRAGLVTGDAIVHTDHGSQYHVKAYWNMLRQLSTRQRTSRTGSCLEGTAAESFFATIKTETGTRTDRATVRRDIENWIMGYKQRCPDASLGYQTSVEVGTAW